MKFFDIIKTKLHESVFPQQKWLTKKIPRGWVDKDDLITLIVFESVVHFVEEEFNGVQDLEKYIYELKSNEYPYPFPEHQKNWISANETILKVYRWAKLREKILERQKSTKILFCVYEGIMERYNPYFLKEIIPVIGYMWT